MKLSKTKLHLLLVLLKAYRAHFCWQGDRYEKHVSILIRDVRFAIENDGFYRIESMQVRA